MKKYYGFLTLVAMGVLLFASAAPAAKRRENFASWQKKLRAEARKAGISQKTLDAALKEAAAPLPRVIELDRNQPEATEPLGDYVTDQINPSRVEGGRRMLRRYRSWLDRLERRNGVQRRYIIAMWGIETDYGRRSGGFPVIQTLATLARDDRRGTYFRQELIAALHIIDAGQMTLPRMQGSWAGAMGQCQFMPSSFCRFAVDADGDGRADIWHSVPDVLASIANYLAHVGWRKDLIWGRPVRLPGNFDLSVAGGMKTRLPLSRWQALGVRCRNGSSLPRYDVDASLLLPEGLDGPAYLVYSNFNSLLAWNRSNSFAVAVGTLAEILGGHGKERPSRPTATANLPTEPRAKSRPAFNRSVSRR